MHVGIIIHVWEDIDVDVNFFIIDVQHYISQITTIPVTPPSPELSDDFGPTVPLEAVAGADLVVVPVLAVLRSSQSQGQK